MVAKKNNSSAQGDIQCPNAYGVWMSLSESVTDLTSARVVLRKHFNHDRSSADALAHKAFTDGRAVVFRASLDVVETKFKTKEGSLELPDFDEDGISFEATRLFRIEYQQEPSDGHGVADICRFLEEAFNLTEREAGYIVINYKKPVTVFEASDSQKVDEKMDEVLDLVRKRTGCDGISFSIK